MTQPEDMQKKNRELMMKLIEINAQRKELGGQIAIASKAHDMETLQKLQVQYKKLDDQLEKIHEILKENNDGKMPRVSFAPNQIRCGWCLDLILIPPDDARPDQCPYCEANLSEKGPRYEEYMDKVKNTSDFQMRDFFVQAQRGWQYKRKMKMVPFEGMERPPIVLPYRELWVDPNESKLFTALEYLHENPDKQDVEEQKKRIFEIGKEIYNKGGLNHMKYSFASVVEELAIKYTREFDKYRVLWNGICDEWK